jgi:autotransporter passenger strand-loop-strand repeat protein
LVQSGGFASSTVVKSGGDETVGAGGTASGVVVSSGGTFEWFGSNPIVAGAQFRSGATVAVGSGYVFSGNVSGGITELIFFAGSARGSTVSGATQIVQRGRLRHQHDSLEGRQTGGVGLR